MTTSNIEHLPALQKVEEEANAWIVAFEEGDPSPQTLAAFEAWRKQSPLHEETYQRLMLFWREADVMERLGDYAESDAAQVGMRHDQFHHRVTIARRVGLGAIAATLVGVAGVHVFDQTFGPGRSFAGEFRTAIGEQETVALPDGSEIVLNTDSALQVAYTRGARTINLERGEAYFDVASNKNRPFSVETEKGWVTAIGTAFTVRLANDELSVVVSEGRVALDVMAARHAAQGTGAPPRQPQQPVIEVEAGHLATVDDGVEALSAMTPGRLNKELDWRDGVLTFEGETLDTVITEISRYADLEIEIADDGLKDEKIVAYYKIGSIDSVFEALRLMKQVEVEHVGERHVRLSRAQPAQ